MVRARGRAQSVVSISATAERLTEPLDACRRLALRWLVHSKFMRATLTHRDRRIASVACLNVTVAALGAIYLPMLLFTLGPVLLGVAHLASDVRYLVLRRNLARWWQNVVWLGCLALLGLRVLEELRVLHDAARLELGLAATLVAVAIAAALRERGRTARAALGLTLLFAATVLSFRYPSASRLVFLHLHNVVALAAWGLLFRAKKRWLVAPFSLIAVVTALLASGALYRQTLHSPFVASFHLHTLAVADWVAPFADLRIAVGVTSVYVFLQAVHYSAWLNWIPQEEQPRRGTPTYRMSVRALFADLGTRGVLATTLAAAAVLLGACFELQRSHALYLSLATFHGYVELALLVFFWVRGAGLANAPPAARHASTPPLG